MDCDCIVAHWCGSVLSDDSEQRRTDDASHHPGNHIGVAFQAATSQADTGEDYHSHCAHAHGLKH